MFSDSKQASSTKPKDLKNLLAEGVKYARDIIKTCFTSLEDSELSRGAERLKFSALYKKARSDADREFIAGAHASLLIQASKKNEMGNCREYALLVLDYLLEMKFDGKAELFNLHYGNHVFIVINRKKGSIESEPSTWGEEALICDPWGNIICTPADMMDKIKNLKTNPDGVHQLEKLTLEHKLKKMQGYTLDILKNWQNYQTETGDYRGLFEALMEDDALEFEAQLKIKPPKNINLLYSDGLSLLHLACQLGKLNILNLLLDTKNININLEEMNFEHAPLHVAVIYKQFSAVKSLLDNKASVHAQDYMLETPLHKAVSEGDEEIIKLLLKHGADPYIKNNKNQTCFDLLVAMDKEKRETIEGVLKAYRHKTDLSISDFTLFQSKEKAMLPALSGVTKDPEDETQDLYSSPTNPTDPIMTSQGYSLYD